MIIILTDCACIALTYQLRQDIDLEFKQLLDLAGDDPIFETALLLAGKVNPDIQEVWV